jgi:glycosyltransferase involved in cell wall biosynthesis
MRSLPELAGQVAAAGWTLHFDVSPLFDQHWTGIPRVAAGLAETLLDVLPDRTAFFFRQDLVATDAVRDALARESGLYLERDFQQGHARAGPVPLPTRYTQGAGIYPSVKLVKALFPVECSIYHDISTLLLPQYHTLDNIRHHLAGLVEDIRTNAVTFGVSQATVDDLVAYLGAREDQVFVAGNGVSWPWWFPVQLGNERPAFGGDSYWLVLGTREPRKNLTRVFEAIQLFPEIVERSRLVFVGKSGWLADRQAVPDGLGELVARGRMVFTGYVSSYEKYRLLAGADATIYPSLFEGFGLPVLESLSVGTPCVASWSSAMPEVGGDACRYFDPLSAEDLGLAISRLQLDNPKRSPGYAALCKAISSRFSWPEMLRTMLGQLIPVLNSAGSRY